MGRKPSASSHNDREPVGSLAAFACPNPDCPHFNRFDVGNLSVVDGDVARATGRATVVGAVGDDDLTHRL